MPLTSSAKKQTRLDFDPLPSSSPGKLQQPEAVRDRSAAVTITDSPRQKRRKVSQSFLPTPVASSQQKNESPDHKAESESNPPSKNTRGLFMNRSSQRTRNKVTQSRLAEPSSSELLNDFDDSESDVELPTPARNKRSHKSGDRRQASPNLLSEDDGISSIKFESGEDDDEPSIQSESSEDHPIQPGWKNRESRALRKMSSQENLDLKEDMDFLGPTSKFVILTGKQ